MAGRLTLRDRLENWRAAAKPYIYARPILLSLLKNFRPIQRVICFPYYWVGDWLFEVRTGLGRDIHRRQPESVTTRGPGAPDANEYGTVRPKFFHRAISSLGIDYTQYVFIDVGSGKGVPVLMASQYPFKRVIGVEYVKELHEAAQNNVKLWRPAIKSGSVEFVWADALEFELPLEPCVVCFCDPFGQVTVCRVLERIRESMKICPRDLIIVYMNPAYTDAILALFNPEVLARSGLYQYVILRMTLPS